MIARCVVVLSALLLGLSPAGAAQAAEDRCRAACEVTAGGGEGRFEVEYTAGRSEAVPGRGRAQDGPAPGKTSWTVIDEQMSPTCYGNSRLDPGALCPAAVTTCPDGLIRFWVWHRRTTVTTNPDGTLTRTREPWQQEPGTYCLGADDPGVPTLARVLDLLRRQFSQLPLPVPPLRADPAPTTVLNTPTAFAAGTTSTATFDPVLLGTAVHVQARPVAWHWTWGDGTRQSTTHPGTPRRPDLTHTYTRPGRHTVTVTTEWHGTFTLGTDPTRYPISTPAYTRPAPLTLTVRPARSQLVR